MLTQRSPLICSWRCVSLGVHVPQGETITPGDTMTTIAYVRVSTDEQAQSGLGLEAQRAAIVKAVGEPDATFCDEGRTGSDLRRPAIWDALRSLKRGDRLAVARRDRLGRGMDVMLEIEREVSKRGATIASAAGEGSGEDTGNTIFQRRIFDAANELELWRIRERTAAAMQAKRARGEKTGGDVPFGYRLNADGRTLAEDPDEQRVLSLMRRLREEGETLRAIGDHLRAKGYTSRKGTTTWHPQTIKQLLDRAA